MEVSARGRLDAELADVNALLAGQDVIEVLARIDGSKSMARLTAANLAAFEHHVGLLGDDAFALDLLASPDSLEHHLYVERLQHLAANYFLSAVPLLEHVRNHVKRHYPDPDHQTRVQHDRGLKMAVHRYDGHNIVVRLRHMVAHRQLPTVRLVAGQHPQQRAAPTIDRRELLDDPDCKGKERKLLLSLPMDELSLDGLVLDDGRFVMEFVEWFFQIQSMHEGDAVIRIGRLRDRRERLLRELAAERL